MNQIFKTIIFVIKIVLFYGVKQWDNLKCVMKKIRVYIIVFFWGGDESFILHPNMAQPQTTQTAYLSPFTGWAT